MQAIRRIAGGLRRRVTAALAQRARRRATRLLHGPDRVALPDTGVMAVLLVRNGAWFVPRFLDHHLALGVDHILVIDNGSTDGTVDLCRRDRVTVLENTLPVRRHESALRSELAQRVAQGGWILFADSDELVELPLPGPDALARLTGWCNRHGYTAVLGQMLDRFSDRPYAALRDLTYDQAIAALDLYAVEGVETIPYAARDRVEFAWFLRQNRCDDPAVAFKTGGLRRELFGENPFLSKHSLVRNVPGVVPMVHPHAASGVSVADVTLLLHHYKLAGDWVARDRKQVEAATWVHGEDARRIAAVGNGDFRLTPAQPLPWRGIAALREEGFLYASPDFLRETGQSG
ncbi:glycosyltransferase family 2 protein [Neotabrizicola sp. VNH66]|uniref:glycosyltransferase family 2 protein n=1 Tax=Neotabrizicola sp. VNH66 TaxID=3400918 RepID=UPI003C074643